MVQVKHVVKVLCGVLGVLLGVLALLLLVALVRALTLEEIDYQEDVIDPGERDHLPESYLEGLPKLMARALTIPTVSKDPGDYDTEALKQFHDFLRESFPNVFNSSMIEVEVINKFSLLMTVKGLHDDLVPYMLTGHMDVVPVDKEKWTHDPWGGHIIEDPATGETYIWGRGAIDNKIGVLSIMMALEYLAKTNFQPERSFYVAFGHDEEVRGSDGAGHVAKVLESRGVQLDFILDEGVPILQGVIEGPGGHSSIPPKNSAMTRLAKAIVALEDNPQPSLFGKGPEAEMMSYIAPKASWPFRLVYANLWLFRPFLSMYMSTSRETNAVIRTTTSVTIVRAGVKTNVVPSSASAIVNHRIHPSQEIRDVIQRDKDVIADPSVKIKLVEGMEPLPVSPYGPDVSAWRLLTAAIHHHYPDAITAPTVLVGNTDTVHYLNFTSNVYRLTPVLMAKKDTQMIHGKNERISVSNMIKAIRIYHWIMVWGSRWT